MNIAILGTGVVGGTLGAKLVQLGHKVKMGSRKAAAVAEILRAGFGWKDVIDLGDLTAARGLEMILPLWLRLWGNLKTPLFNFKMVR